MEGEEEEEEEGGGGEPLSSVVWLTMDSVPWSCLVHTASR
jgi:hypothetical protein